MKTVKEMLIKELPKVVNIFTFEYFEGIFCRGENYEFLFFVCGRNYMLISTVHYQTKHSKNLVCLNMELVLNTLTNIINSLSSTLKSKRLASMSGHISIKGETEFH